jgi:hypothetical protein
MSSINYDSFFDDLSKGNVSSGDTYYMMLVTSSYTPSKGSHAKRSDVTNEVSGTGYTAGGQAVTITEAVDTSGHKVTWTPGTVTWSTATISAAGAVIYKHRGGAASADNLVGYIDFGGTVTSTGGNFTVTNSAPLTIQN